MWAENRDSFKLLKSYSSHSYWKIQIIFSFVFSKNFLNIWTFSNWFAALDALFSPCGCLVAMVSGPHFPSFPHMKFNSQFPVATLLQRPPRPRGTVACHIMTGKAVKQFHQPSGKLPPLHAPRASFRFVLLACVGHALKFYLIWHLALSCPLSLSPILCHPLLFFAVATY